MHDPTNIEMDCLLFKLMLAAVVEVASDAGFTPFGGVLNAGGVEPIEVNPADHNRQAPAPDVLAYLEQTILMEGVAKGARAVASVADVVVTRKSGEETDAIRVHMETAEGFASDVILPYAKRRLGGFSFGALEPMDSEPRIFSEGGSADRPR